MRAMNTIQKLEKEQIDRLSAEKLRVLAGTYSSQNGPDDQREACGFLRSAGASWFVRFAHNWRRA